MIKLIIIFFLIYHILVLKQKETFKQEKVIILACVENSYRAVELWSENYKQLNKYYNVFDIILVHFDGNNDIWKQNFPYYRNNNIRYVIKKNSCKASNWEILTPNLVKYYDYVWLMDGDILLKDWCWYKYRKELTKFDLISQPAIKPFKKNGRSSDYKFLRYKSYVNTSRARLIEQQVPFISTKLWPIIYEKILLSNKRSSWGIEFFWNRICRRILSNKFLVVHSSPVIHLDWKTIGVKNNNCLRKFIRSPDPKNINIFVNDLKIKLNN